MAVPERASKSSKSSRKADDAERTTPPEQSSQSTNFTGGVEDVWAQGARASEVFFQGASGQGLDAGGFADFFRDLTAAIGQNTERWRELQEDYFKEQAALFARTLGAHAGLPIDPAAANPAQADRRFAAAEWREMPLFDYVKTSYLLTSKWLTEAVRALDVDKTTKAKLDFYTRQFLDAASPANFLATNPEALRLAYTTQGESLSSGLRNLLQDMDKGRISMTDEAAFEVGRNIAASVGAVVFENDLIQLIQYAPLTKTVAERPLLLVPPCINKYYLMDLEPENSFVRYAVEQGLTVFMISWRNVKQDLQHLTWDDYLEMGVLQAIDVAKQICNVQSINVLGFCVGGTLVASALAVAAARKDKSAASVTLMTSLVEFSDVGDIGVYVDRDLVARRERQFKDGGLVPGKELAAAFSSLRANDLIWSYVVNNYLKGKSPDAFNLLYWNSDGTNLPGPMYSYYLRNMYLENNLVVPDRLTMCEQPIDLARIALPTYIFGAREDHIVPWKSAFEATAHLKGELQFVLGASGHIAGSMNPPSKNKRNYWAGGELGKGAEHWLATASSIEGSWWSHWSAWQAKFSGKQVAARSKLGSTEFRSSEPAPGRYVLERCDP